MSFISKSKEEHPQYVESSFSRIAEKYDFFNDIVSQGLHRYWKNYLVKKADLQKNDRVLDICCGTGDITFRLDNALKEKNAHVYGLDFSAGMLLTAQSRKECKDLSFIRADAMSLPIKDQSLDVVTIGYGLRNLVDLNGGIDEIIRVLKPGGKLLSLDMGKINIPIIKQLFHLYFFYIVPFIGF